MQETAPTKAYNLWASGYDQQPANLMLSLDEIVFAQLLEDMEINGKTIVDIGCGTGRHWRQLFDRKPSSLTGYDVSEKMLQVLKQKFPAATTHLLHGDKLDATPEETVDIIISTLTIAHIEKPATALGEWNRVLKPGGHIVITDYHPGALEKGGKRTFVHKGKTISVKNHVHSIEKITGIAEQLHWQKLRLVEKTVDESARPWYEQQDALAVYESFKGTPVIYGILFTKRGT